MADSSWHRLSILIQPPLSQGTTRLFNDVRQRFPWGLSQSELCFCPITYNRRDLDAPRGISGVGTWPAVEDFPPSRVEMNLVQHRNHYSRDCGMVDIEMLKALDVFYFTFHRIQSSKQRGCASLPHRNTCFKSKSLGLPIIEME